MEERGLGDPWRPNLITSWRALHFMGDLSKFVTSAARSGNHVAGANGRCARLPQQLEVSIASRATLAASLA